MPLASVVTSSAWWPAIQPASTDALDAQVAVGTARLELAQVAVQHDPPVVDERDGLAEVLDEVELVAREQEVPPGAHVGEDHLRQELDGGRVEAGEGLVEHEHVGLVDHGRRQLHPLGHAAGQVLDLVLGAVGEAEPLEEVARVGLAGRLVEAVEARDPREQVEHAHVSVQAALLRHVAPRAAVVFGRGTVAPRHGAGVRLQDAEQDAHQRGLAGAVGPEQPDDPARGHVEVDALQHDAVAEPLADAARLQGVGHPSSLPKEDPCSHFGSDPPLVG